MTRDGKNFYWAAFTAFLKIGAFTIGGGYAMVPLVEAEVVDRRRWMSRTDFLDLLAIAQACPGLLAVNMAIYVGWKMRGLRGAVVTTLGSVLPSFCIILAIAMAFTSFKDNALVEKVFKGMRPAVTALIAAASLSLGRSARVTRRTLVIPLAVAALIWGLGCSPVWMVAAAAVGGWCYGRFFAKRPDPPANP